MRGGCSARSGQRRLFRSIGWKCLSSRLGMSVNAITLRIDQLRTVFLYHRTRWQAA